MAKLSYGPGMGGTRSIKFKIPLYLDEALRQEQRRRLESMGTIIREALHAHLGIEGRTLARVARNVPAEDLHNGEVSPSLSAPSPGTSSSSGPNPEAGTKLKAKISKSSSHRSDDIVMHPSTTGLEREIRIPLAKVRAIFSHLPGKDSPHASDTDEQTARRIAPLVGLGVLEVMEVLARLAYDDALVTKLEILEAQEQEAEG